MMKTLFIAACLLAATNATAQAYKCVINGKAVYADAPCAANARNVGALEDQLSQERQVQRLQQSIKERRQRNSIESSQEADFQARQRVMVSQANAEAAQAASANRAKASRCTDQQRDLRYNQQAQARYRDFGWQNSLSQREQDAKALREGIDRDCR